MVDCFREASRNCFGYMMMMMMMMMIHNGYSCQLMRPQRHNVKDDMTTFEELHFKEPTFEPTMKSQCHAFRKYFLMNVVKQCCFVSCNLLFQQQSVECEVALLNILV